ncbi:MAG: murein biosynthesis integral membrane protein MurJ [Candidatus Yanofskybacteria bacterium]|nr:murein biosynthesis integral membrane protein MurJ [Candidatus Yanofskybacteria bacterium]
MHPILTQIKRYLFGSIFRRGATLLTALTFGSYALGLVRDILFARVFGASRLLDVYNAAFIIPDLLLNIFVAGALTAAFVPVFAHLYARNEDAEAEKVATTMLVVAPLILIIIALPVFIFMPRLADTVAPGFAFEDKELLVLMARLLLLSPIIFAVSNTLGNILISFERFWGYGLAPIFYNIGIIIGVPLAKAFGPLGLIGGVIIGALMHLAVRWADIAKSRIQWRFPIQWRHPEFRKILRLMVPRMAGQPIEQVIFFVFTNIASTLAAGSIVVLSFARNFQSVPVSLFGIAFSTAVFASLSKKAALGDRVGFLYHFRETAKALGIMAGLSALFFFFFGEWIVRLFLGGGRFLEADVAQTGRLLAIFAFAIPAESFMHLIARSFYALKDTWTPLFVTLPGLVVIAFLAKVLVPALSLSALPVSYAVVITIEVLLLFGILRTKLSRLS